MKKGLLALLVIITLLIVTACAQPVAGMVLQSDKERETTPNASQADLTALVEGNSHFAFNLYQPLRTADGNLFYSPCSISVALAMTYGGARNDTEKEMAETLHFTLPQSQLHPAFNSLDIDLSQRGKGAKGKDGDAFQLHIVNAIWGQKDYQFLPAYLDLLSQNYGAGLRLLDFKNESENSRITINKWVSDQTEQRIKDLIPQGVIDRMTRLVLTNAIYFNAAWQYPFDKNVTQDGTFYLTDGTTVTVPMMQQTESLGYAEGDDYQVAELPYDGRELSMVILLPRSERFEPFESSLNAQQVNEILENIEPSQVRLSMPKFEFESSFSLKNALTDMGMPIAFTEYADFSGMTSIRELFIGDVLHKAFVSVDEAGTEAAAATAVVMKVTSIPAEPVEVTVDRPFIFLIHDLKTGTILFIGRVLNPTI